MGTKKLSSIMGPNDSQKSVRLQAAKLSFEKARKTTPVCRLRLAAEREMRPSPGKFSEMDSELLG